MKKALQYISFSQHYPFFGSFTGYFTGGVNLWISRSVAMLLIVSFLLPPAFVPTFLYADEGRVERAQDTATIPLDGEKPVDQDHTAEAPVFDVAPKDREKRSEIEKEQTRRDVLTLPSEDTNGIVENPNTVKSLLPDIDTFSGSLIYKYPIVLPPGRNNLTPDLELTYNSGVAINDSVFGYGWSISIPYIERINRKGSDKLYSRNDFSSSLSGELVAKTGTTTYTAKIEDGSFLNYVRVGNAWVVTDKQGTRYTFGSTTASRLDNASTTSEIYKWMVDEIRDTNDNFIRFEYSKDQNQIYPSSIIYTGHGSTDGIFEVNFSYEGRDDEISTFAPKFEVTTINRLANIEINVNSTTTKEYEFTYTPGHNNNRSLLASVAVISGTTTLPATEFEYQTIPTNLEFNSSSFQLPSFYRPSTTDYYFMALSSKNRLIDVNGDGRLDFVRTSSGEDADGIIPNNNNDGPRVYLNTGSGWEFDPDLYQLPSFYRPSTTDYYFMELNDATQLLDVNGDNLPDFVRTGSGPDDDGIIPDNNNDKPRVYLNTGTGWTFDPSQYQLPSFYRPGTNDYYFTPLSFGDHDTTQLLDVNNDGLPDYVRTSDADDADGNIPNNNGDAPRVYLNTGSGWVFNASKYQLPSFYRTGSSDYYFMSVDDASRFVDVNGDGLLDFLHTGNAEDADGIIPDNNNDAPRVYLNTGNGWEFDSSHYQLPSFYRTGTNDYYFFALKDDTHDSTQLLDINGDSLVDFVRTADSDDADGIIPNNNNDAPRAYLNTGNGWTFDANQYQLPSFYRPSTTDYYFMSLKSANQFVDVNGDNLPDFVRSGDGEDSDGIIPDNNNDKPRAYLNTGRGWVFDADAYQLPSFYRPSTTDYYFTELKSSTEFTDVNNDGLQDFVRTFDVNDADGMILNNNNDGPRAYANIGKTADYLSAVTFLEGGSTSFDYTTEIIKGRNPTSPYYSQNVNVLKHIVTNDGLGNFATSTYEYEDGEYYYHSDPFKQFVGFREVHKTDPAGNVTKSYFHQGNSSATSTGEYDDHVSKAGRAYRTEQYDNSGNLFSKTINKWDHYEVATSSATSSFVKLVDTVEFTYDGDAGHKDKAESYVYNNANGNLSQKIVWGEVTGSDNGTFADTGTDKFTTAMTYATSSATSSVAVVVPSRELVLSQASTTVTDTKIYYDNLAYGSVSKGNSTKQEVLKSGPTFIDTEKTYNSYGLVTQEKDPRDKTTTHSYDTYNLLPATTTNPAGHVTTFVYDYSLGKPIQVTDPNSRTFQTVYDGFGRVIEEKQPDVNSPSTLVTKSSYVYNDSVFPTSVIKTNHFTTSSSVTAYAYFDGLGRIIQERRNAEDSNVYTAKDTIYNSTGQKQKESLPHFSTGSSRTIATTTASLYNHFTYDALGRIKTIANSVGTTTNIYDDWKLSVTDANGKTKDLTKDARGNLVQVEEHNATSTYVTTYEWNGLGNLTKITDALGNVRNFTYNNLGQRLTAEDLHALGDTYFSTWSYSYDDAGNMASTTDGRGQTIQYTFDDINRPLTENYTGQAGTEVTYAYDDCTNGKGRLCIATNASSMTQYAYDTLGRVATNTKTLVGEAYSTVYSYDYAGNPRSIIDPNGGETSYTYNAGGLVETVSYKPVGGSLTSIVDDIDYSPEGKIVYQLNGNDTFTQNTYDAGQLYRLTNRYSESPLGGVSPVLQDIEYIYDAVGNIVQMNDESPLSNAKTVLYTYDDLYRLTSASTTATNAGSGYNEQYTYDAIGNILTKGNSVTTYSYQGTTTGSYANPHAVTKIRNSTHSYDNNGNVLYVGGKATSTWDYNNRLSTLSMGATTTTYAYDHSGDRVLYSNGTSLTVYPDKYVNMEIAGVITSTTTHIFLGDTAIATIEHIGTTTNTHFTHTDHLSGANVSTDTSGAVTEMTDYYPYGSLRVSDDNGSGFTEQRKFTGHEYDDETNLSYMGARYYDGTAGRFRSIDPIYLLVGDPQLESRSDRSLEMYLSDPQSLNSYSYVNNNPLKYTDPNGEILPVIAAIGVTAYVMTEMGLSAYDVYSTIKTLGDSNASFGEKSLSASLTVAGFALPLGGYGKADDAARGINNIRNIAKQTRWGNPFTLVTHTFDHAHDFGLARTDFEGYAKAVDNFISGADNAIREGSNDFDFFVGTGDKAGKMYFFNKKTSTFGVRNADGTNATAYKPKGGDSVKALKYWNKKKKSGGN